MDCCSVRLSCICLSVCNVGLLWPNGWLDQDETWRGGRPLPRPHCVRWGSSFPQRDPAPNFRPVTFMAKRLDGSRCHLYGGRPRLRRHRVRWGSSCLKKGTAPSPCSERDTVAPSFRPMSIVAKRLPILATAEHLSNTVISTDMVSMVFVEGAV